VVGEGMLSEVSGKETVAVRRCVGQTFLTMGRGRKQKAQKMKNRKRQAAKKARIKKRKAATKKQR
jgi:hypothetical protein